MNNARDEAHPLAAKERDGALQKHHLIARGMIIAFLLALVAVPAFAGLLPSGSDDSDSSGDTTDEAGDAAVDDGQRPGDDLTVAAESAPQRAVASLSNGRDLRVAQAETDAEQAAAAAAAAAATSTTTSTVPPTTAAPTTVAPTTSTPPSTAPPTTTPPPPPPPPTTTPPPPPPPPPTAPAPAVTGGPWDSLAACESGGNWSINTGNGYYGGLQFMKSTWLGYGGADFADYPHHASRDQQIAVAERVVAAAGGSYRAWPSCSAKLGLP